LDVVVSLLRYDLLMTSRAFLRSGLLALIALVLSGSVPAAAVENGCAERFPGVAWTPAESPAGVSISTVDVASAVAARFGADAAEVAALLSADLAALEPIELCLFGPDIKLDGAGIVPSGQRIQAAALGPESLVVVSTLELKRVKPAIAYGLAYAALWDEAQSLELSGYPQPLADAVAQWYMARAMGNLEAHHSTMLRANFLQDPSGTRPASDWTAAGDQDRVFAWNPEFVESPAGDLVNFAVETHGAAVLSDPSSETWATLETEYRAALHEELFGDVGGSFGWPWGLTIVVVILVLAVVLSSYEWRRKRRARQQRPVSEPPIEGLFEQ
jgi:plastocyanin